MAIPTLTNNSPAAGSISWGNFTLQYAGVPHALSGGNTSQRYAYWQLSSPSTIQTSSTLPTLGADDCLLFINRGGTAVNVIDLAPIDGGLINPGTLDGSFLQDNTLSGVKIQDGTIPAAKIADATIPGAKLVAQTVTATQLAANAVGSGQLADGSVGTGKLADNSVTTAKLAAGAVQTTDIADGAVTAAKIASVNGSAITTPLSGRGLAYLGITGSTTIIDTLQTYQITASGTITGQTLTATGGINATGTANVGKVSKGSGSAQGTNYIVVTRDTDYTLPNNVWTTYGYNVTKFSSTDDGAIYSNPNLTSRAAGVYHFTISHTFAVNGTGYRGIRVVTAGGSVIAEVYKDGASSAYLTLSGSGYYPGGGYGISVQVFQNSGAGLLMPGNDANSPQSITFCQIA